MTHHGRPEEHGEEPQSEPVVHGGEGDPLGEGVAEAAGEQGGDAQPPLPDDEPKPGL